MARILVFGDSIVFGLWDKQGGWTNRLRTELDKLARGDPNRHIQLYILGIAGETSTGVLERCESEILQRLPKTKEVSIVISVGTNDTQLVKSESRVRTSPEKFRENIEKIIEVSRRYTANILFVGLTPIVEEKTSPIPWNTDKFYGNGRIKEYDNILRKVCAAEKIPFVELMSLFQKSGEERLLFDGLHPNSKGHELIFQEVKKALEANKYI